MATATYTVTGMTCQHCVRHVTSELEELPGVSSVVVTLEPGRAVIGGDNLPGDDAVIAAVAEAGDYTAVRE